MSALLLWLKAITEPNATLAVALCVFVALPLLKIPLTAASQPGATYRHILRSFITAAAFLLLILAFLAVILLLLGLR